MNIPSQPTSVTSRLRIVVVGAGMTGLTAARDLPLSQDFKVESAVAHRWRYALARKPLDCGAIWLSSKNLALAGDWCHGSRVEGAFLSGTEAAERIIKEPPSP